MNIAITDYIGTKSGMDSYTKSMNKCMEKLNFTNVEVFSNHSNYSNHYFMNVFGKNYFNKLYAYIVNIFRFYKLLFFSKKDLVIHQYYGSIIDLPVLILSLVSNRIILDIHELSMIDKKQPILDLINKLILKFTRSQLIIHSEINKKKLIEMKVKPIIKNRYILCKQAPPEIIDNYNLKKVAPRLVDFYKKNDTRHKFLFFGDMRPSKGIKKFLEMANSKNFSNDIFVCVGQDSFNILSSSNNIKENILIEDRRVDDEELHFLFTKSDFIVLPYEYVSQSGIVDIAIYLKCKIICSEAFHDSMALSNYDRVIFYDFYKSDDLNFYDLKNLIVDNKYKLNITNMFNYYSYDSSIFESFILNTGNTK